MTKKEIRNLFNNDYIGKREQLYELIEEFLSEGYKVCLYPTELDTDPIICFENLDDYKNWKTKDEAKIKETDERIKKFKKGN